MAAEPAAAADRPSGVIARPAAGVYFRVERASALVVRRLSRILLGSYTPMPMSTLERAIAIAAEAHAGQRDKGGAPYVLHPLRVMLRLDAEADRIAGVLHDVVEDSPWTLDDLRAEGFSEAVVRALDHLTRREGESYEAFVRRASTDPIGARVKAADLEENMDLGRIPAPTARDRARLMRYEQALAVLRPGPHAD